ncbi:hypothetical protein ACFE04_012298 [Oxalis oulophora]
MASKFGLAGGIPERRVRPIWDAIDSRQFKNALKLSTSLLTKFPNSPYALALKALILERMGKSDEALSVCLIAKDCLYKSDSMLMDDLTLSTLQIVFQRLHHCKIARTLIVFMELDLATSCYDYACTKFPNNSELMMGLFNCYVREYSFVKQQQTAIKMYKLSGEERFLLWAVCSIQLQQATAIITIITVQRKIFMPLQSIPQVQVQVQTLNPIPKMVLCGNGGDKLLLLAEGLIKKHVAAHSLHDSEALIVYLSILEQQLKFNDALEVLSGNLGSLLMIEVDKLRIQGRLLARVCDYTSAASVYQKILELCPDDWECLLHYLGCLLEDDSTWRNGGPNRDSIHLPMVLDCNFSHLTDELFDSRISNASAFVNKLQEDNDNNSMRGPYLASLEIERRKHLYGKHNDDELVEALVQYFHRFGHLTCCSSDIEMFLQVLTADKKTEFLEKVMDSLNIDSAVSIKVLGQSITVGKIEEMIGNIYKLPEAELVHYAVKMVDIYCKNLPLSKDLDPQESIHGEDLLSMASNVLVQLYWRTRNTGYFMEAIMLLEFGLKIWRFKSLDVKNILMESVLHLILPQMLASPFYADLNNLLKDYLKFMDDHFRESADLTFVAYRHRNYSKVIEFVQFKERLQHSSQYLVSRVETSILQLKQNADNIEEEEGVLESMNCGTHFVELSNEIGSKSLTFNEDLQIRPWWAPTPEKNYLLDPFEGISYCPKKDAAEKRDVHVRRVIGRKSLIPRLVYLSIQNTSASLRENLEVNGSVSSTKVSGELKLLLEKYAKMLGFSLTDAIHEVSSGLQSSEGIVSDMIDWLNFAVFWNAWNLISHDGDGHGPADTWHIVNSLLHRYILDKVKNMKPLIRFPGSDLPTLVKLVTEPLAWHSLVIQSCVRSCLPCGKKKKKSGGPTDQSTSLLAQAIRDTIGSLYSTVECVANWLREELKRPDDDNIEFIVSMQEQSGPGQVFQTVEKMRSSINEAEVGSRISQALKSWSPEDVARKISGGQRTILAEFLCICEAKMKSLTAVKLQIAQL